MPVAGLTFKTATRFTLGVALLGGLITPSWADALHFHNGKVIYGKLSRLTGDIIEFKEGHQFAPPKTVQRIHLTNRHDIVETRDGRKYFGEIIYVDVFKIDMRTSTGQVKLNRLKVTNAVLGTPNHQMGVPDPTQIQTQPIESPALSHTSQPSTSKRVEPTDSNKPLVHFPSTTSDLSASPADSSPTIRDDMYPTGDEDMDAIPAVDRMP